MLKTNCSQLNQTSSSRILKVLAVFALLLFITLEATPLHAAQYWDDTFALKHWETSADVCTWGEAEARVAERRKLEPSRTWRYSALAVDEYLPGEESRCQFMIEYRFSLTWVPWAIYDMLHYRFGLPDYCQRGTLDPATGRCRPKMGGPTCPANGTNPCDGATGNKYQVETDYEATGPAALVFRRHYNGLMRESGPLGAHWRSNYQRTVLYSESYSRATVFREDGRALTFASSGTAWIADADVHDKLVQLTSGGNPAGWRYSLTDGTSEDYDVAGRLTAITDNAGRVTQLAYDTSGRLATVTNSFGQRLSFGYDASNRISTMTDPATGVYTYNYDANNNLSGVTYPDTRARVYLYENPSVPDALTGIVDENNQRFATFGFNTLGSATSSEHAGGQERHTLAYISPTRTDITDPANNVTTYNYSDQLGVLNLVSRSMPADGKSLTQTFDPNNNLTCKKDEENHVTTYTYNSTNQKLSMTEGQGGDCNAPIVIPGVTRTTSYQYVSSTLDLPTLISSPSVYTGQTKTTLIQYTDTSHPNLPTIITQNGFTPTGTPASRTVSLGYNAAGQVTSINGPRTDALDITNLSYYTCTTGGSCGQLQSVTNAVGQITTYDSYDPNGRLLQMTDPNGLRTNYTYDPRGRLRFLTQTPPIGSARTTEYRYDFAGQLTQALFPDGRSLTYGYDAAHQLRTVTDNLGNQVRYNYDLKGNRTQDYTYDPSNTLVRQIDVAYDLRNHVSSINAAGSLTQQIHDAVGNLIRDTDPNNNPASQHTPDALNRLVQTIDRLSGVTGYTYDVNDRTKNVVSPNDANTQYVYDDLGNLLSESSFDRGLINYQYDNAGNLTQKTDGRGIITRYTYDPLNRLVTVDYPGAAEDVTYNYDSCPLGLGRLCQQTDASGLTTYAYDAFGNILNQSRTVGSLITSFQYTYDAANRIQSITYPDTSTITYTRDAVGRITGINRTVSGLTTALLSNRQYRADGLMTNQFFGNGLNETRSYDLQGRLLHQTLGTLDTRDYANYDGNGNLKLLTATGFSATYNYDPLDRLLTESSTVNHNYNYDPNGNRTNDSGTAYIYQAASNRLSSIGGTSLTLDPAGNTLTDHQGRSFTYNNAGDLATASQSGLLKASYVYDAAHHRTQKILPSGATLHYHYSPDGNLIAETNPQGQLLQTYVVADSIPIAIINADQDGDGIIDTLDNCIYAANANQRDTDNDGYGNICDADLNNDGLVNSLDLSRFKQVFFTNNADADLNGDGIVNSLDLSLFKQLFFKAPGPSGPKGQATPPIVSYLYTDHLGTPRIATDNSGKMVWRNDGSAFGDTSPNEDVEGDGRRTVINVRFSGQYYDAETGLHYNWNRYYDPKLGRYITSDPIGLDAGLNTYVYVDSNPLGWIDPKGLAKNNPNTTYKNCGPTEWSECKKKCGNKGVLGCQVQITKKVRRIIDNNGNILERLHFDRTVNCECGDDDPKTICGSDCKRNLAIAGLIVGGFCLAGPAGSALGGLAGLAAQ
ncbi:MAG: RHS repeat protein [Gammaproteobacteria bacterium]|nr:RHS repeat protein [Gammaproteobacteria bacterium]